MPGDKPLVACPLVPPGSSPSVLYQPWFTDRLDLLLAEEDGDFLTALILGVRAERIDPLTAVFAETDLLINGWHTADTPQPDRAALHKVWGVLLTATVHLKRKS